jgi:disease resistance protein RPS2
MEFVVSIMDTVFQQLKDYFAWTLGYLMSCGEYIDALGHQMNKLRSKRDDLNCSIPEVEAANEELQDGDGVPVPCGSWGATRCRC